MLRKDRWLTMGRGVCGILAVAVIYLVSELLIWGLSRALAPAKLEFFSSVFGMLLVFAVMMIACALIPNLNVLYEKYMQSKVSDVAPSPSSG